jgi:hypothetical protein
MAQAEVAIHLLGERAGFAPERELAIVPLQLRLAAGRQLPRLIWAPTLLIEGSDGGERDPQKVLCRLQGEEDALRSGDKLVGDNEVSFVQFVVDYLAARPPARALSPIPPGSSVYLDFDRNDIEAATLLGQGIEQLDLRLEMGAAGGDEARRDARRIVKLLECDVVILCWSQADDIWVRSQADRLDWQKLGREKQFDYRSVVQLKPPDDVKQLFRRLPPRRYIDDVIDATQVPATPADIADLLRQRLPLSQGA